MIYLVENAPPKHRGFWGGFAPLGVSVGNLMAAGAFALVTMLPREELMSWGWRVPFLASVLLIAVGIYVRLRVSETPVYTEAVVARKKVESNPAMAALRKHPRNFMVVLGARLAENGLGYLFPVWGLSYVISLGVPRADALSALMVAFIVELFTILGFAALSDRVGRRPVYMFGALAGVALAFPFFWLVETKEWIYIALAFILARAVRDGGDVRAAGLLLRRALPAAATLRGLRLRPRAGLAAGRRPGAVPRDSVGGVGQRLLVAGVDLRDRARRCSPPGPSGPAPRPTRRT